MPSEPPILENLAAVCKRPGIYVGDVADGSALHRLLWEVVENAVDEHREGTARTLDVSIDDDEVTVSDDGCGIPVNLVPSTARSALEHVFTVIGQTSKHHPGLGLSVVNALCARVEVEVTRDGIRYRLTFDRGVPVEPVRAIGPATRAGTTLKFAPDPEIFGSIRFDQVRIAERLRELARENPGLAIRFGGVLRRDDNWKK